MKATIGINFKRFDQRYKEIVLFSVLRMEDVISSNYFLEALEDEIADSNNMEGELSEYGNASVTEIYAQLFPITLYLNTYFTFSDVIGYGLSSDDDIYINTKYLSKYSIDNPLDLMEIGSNILHEHGHNVGFDHDYKSTSRRPNSISYILNRAYERAFRKFYGLPEPVIVLKSPWYRRAIRTIKGWF